MARNRHENYIVRTLNGLAYGYFVSVVFGIILKQIGTAVHINMLYQWGVMLGYLMGPAIGIAMGLCIDARGDEFVDGIAGWNDRCRNNCCRWRSDIACDGEIHC